MYQIIKGWPSTDVLDVAYPSDQTLTVDEGIAVTINASGKVAPATNADETIQGFLIGRERVTKMCTVLLHDFIVEMDGEHYDTTATFTAGCNVAAMSDGSGKLAPAASGDVVLGRVLSLDAVTGKIRVVVA